MAVRRRSACRGRGDGLLVHNPKYNSPWVACGVRAYRNGAPIDAKFWVPTFPA